MGVGLGEVQPFQAWEHRPWVGNNNDIIIPVAGVWLLGKDAITSD